jgi:hypothetical protein
VIIKEDVFTEQIYILRDFLYHYVSYKKFDSLIKLGSQEFWVFTINAHFYQAINLWCMVFGKRSNETHWSKLGIKEKFSAFSAMEPYKEYWEEITDWRNKNSAHRNPGTNLITPELKLARNIVYLYEEWKYKKIDRDYFLKSYEENFSKELNKTLVKLISFPKKN